MTITEKDIKYLNWCIGGAGIFSTCSKRQFMAIIVDPKGHVIGTGYNGGPPGTKHCVDGGCPRAIAGSAAGSSYDNCIAIHAEENALLHSNYADRQNGGTIYVNGAPCYGCTKSICNSGLTRVVYLDTPSSVYEGWDEIRLKFDEVGIEVNGWTPEENTESFEVLEFGNPDPVMVTVTCPQGFTYPQPAYPASYPGNFGFNGF